MVVYIIKSAGERKYLYSTIPLNIILFVLTIKFNIIYYRIMSKIKVLLGYCLEMNIIKIINFVVEKIIFRQL